MFCLLNVWDSENILIGIFVKTFSTPTCFIGWFFPALINLINNVKYSLKFICRINIISKRLTGNWGFNLKDLICSLWCIFLGYYDGVFKAYL